MERKQNLSIAARVRTSDDPQNMETESQSVTTELDARKSLAGDNLLVYLVPVTWTDEHNPRLLHVMELKRWLKCRGAAAA